MPSVIYPIPPQETLLDFIIQSNGMAQIDLSHEDVQNTLQRRVMNPAVHGHLAGIQYLFELANKSDTPVRHPVEFDSIQNSDKNLDWLRLLHKRVMTPISQYGDSITTLNLIISPQNCGNYRTVPDTIGFDRRCPDPKAIPALMHWWHKDLGQFHLKWTPKIGKILTLDDAETLANEAYNKHIQLACIHPWRDGNGRVGRLLENLLRLRWGLAWKTIHYKKRMNHIGDIMQYEDSPQWKAILKQHS